MRSLIWRDDERLTSGGVSAHIECEPEITLFAIENIGDGLWSLKGAFVPDEDEDDSGYDSRDEAKDVAHSCYEQWLKRNAAGVNPEAIAGLVKALETKMKNDEQATFEHWCEAERPSGDSESVTRQWERSSDFLDLQEEWNEINNALANLSLEESK